MEFRARCERKSLDYLNENARLDLEAESTDILSLNNSATPGMLKWFEVALLMFQRPLMSAKNVIFTITYFCHSAFRAVLTCLEPQLRVCSSLTTKIDKTVKYF